MADLLVVSDAGLYCPAGDFWIDPWRPVLRAVVTHAHADHARRGHGAYLATAMSAGVLRARLGAINLRHRWGWPLLALFLLVFIGGEGVSWAVELFSQKL